jgi:hypothetical protein
MPGRTLRWGMGILAAGRTDGQVLVAPLAFKM